MNRPNPPTVRLPQAKELRRAVELYLVIAYGQGEPPATVGELVPPEQFDPASWLMGPQIERDPRDALLENVRSFGLRLGNWAYPHMKLRLSRPPNEHEFLLSVDAHDAFLFAPAGSSDATALAQMKQSNATIGAAILAAWDEANLPTERNYLRRKIREVRTRDHARHGHADGESDVNRQ
ncbi:MAG TPA: hypothetical protein PKG77_24685 [Phycisphaerae bacterium]|nr:hypothetical protein [Phycisphaerae bacterium]HQL76498.1 hypothetical protein [Phycisphaerae bacterium]